MAEKIEITPEMEAVVGVDSAPWTFEVTTTSVRAFARGCVAQDSHFRRRRHSGGHRSTSLAYGSLRAGCAGLR